MATIYWRGDAPAVAQVDSFTPAGVVIGDTYTVTINGKAVTFTATVNTVAHVTAGLTALLRASTYPEFLEVDWSDQTTYIKGTSNVAGVPFTATASSTGTGTLTRAAVTANSGPNDISIAANWQDGVAPGSADDVVVRGGAHWLYGLDRSAVGTWNSLLWLATADTRCGVPEWNSSGYKEYRDTHLKVNVSTVVVGGQAGGAHARGTDRFKLNALATDCSFVVLLVKRPDGQEPAVSFIGTGAANVVSLHKGSAHVGVIGAATVSRLIVADPQKGSVVAGSEDPLMPSVVSLATVTTCYASGRVSLALLKNPTTLYAADGASVSVEAIATGTLTTCTVLAGGSVAYKSTRTITTLNLAGAFDNAAGGARTITNTNLYPGFHFRDVMALVTFSNPIETVGCALAAGRLDLGNARTYTVN